MELSPPGGSANGGSRQGFNSQAWALELSTSPGGDSCPSPGLYETGGITPQTTMPRAEHFYRSDPPDDLTSWLHEEISLEAGMQQILPPIEVSGADVEVVPGETDHDSVSHPAAAGGNTKAPTPATQCSPDLPSACSYPRTTPTLAVALPSTGTATDNIVSLYRNTNNSSNNGNGDSSIGLPLAVEINHRNIHHFPAHYGSRKNAPVGEAGEAWEGVTAVPAMLPNHPADRFLAAAAAVGGGGGGGGGGDRIHSFCSGACGGEYDVKPRINKGKGRLKSNDGSSQRLTSSVEVAIKYLDSSEDELDKEARRAAVAAGRERRVQNRSVVRAHPFLGTRVMFAPRPVYCMCGHCKLCTSWRSNLWHRPAEPDESDIFAS